MASSEYALRWAIFDHVPKTGGTAVNLALASILPQGSAAINRHVDIAEENFDFAETYPIISGHFGGEWRRRFRRSHSRLTFTIIRDPVKRVMSTYSYWRHQIPEGHRDFWAPTVQAAKTLRFSEFIRTDIKDVKIRLFNTQYAFLSAGQNYDGVCEPENQACHRREIRRLTGEFDVMGVTERLPDAIRVFLAAVGFAAPVDVQAVLAQVERNASPALEEIADEDVAYIASRNELDFELHAIANARLARHRRWNRLYDNRIGRILMRAGVRLGYRSRQATLNRGDWSKDEGACGSFATEGADVTGRCSDPSAPGTILRASSAASTR